MKIKTLNPWRVPGVKLATTKIKDFILHWTCIHRTMKLDGPEGMYCPKCKTKFKI